MMYGWNWNGDWGGMLLVMLLNAVVWVALIGLLIWAVSRFITRRAPTTGHLDTGPSALETLRQRYARGEIDEATFERMHRQLEASGAPAQRDTFTISPPKAEPAPPDVGRTDNRQPTAGSV